MSQRFFQSRPNRSPSCTVFCCEMKSSVTASLGTVMMVRGLDVKKQWVGPGTILRGSG